MPSPQKAPQAKTSGKTGPGHRKTAQTPESDRQADPVARDETVTLTDEERRDLRRVTREFEIARTEMEARSEELRKVSRELEATRDEFFDLYEYAPVAFVALSEKGIVRQANAAARSIMGGAEDTVVGQGFFNFVQSEDQGRYFRAMRKVAATNKTQSFELVLVDRADRRTQVHVQAAPKFDAEGRFRHWHLALFDISTLRRREAQLEQAHAQLAMAARAAKLGAWNYDLTQNTTTWDAGLYRLLSLKPGEGPEDGQRFFDFIHPEDREGTLENLQALLETAHDEIQEEFRVVRADGRTRWLAARGKIFRDAGGRPRHIAGINFDITDRKEAEANIRLAQLQLARQLSDTEQANEELSQYAYAVSHDLKGPLRAIRNYADFLYEDLADTLTGEQKTYLEGMKTAVKQGDALINDLLNLSRIDKIALEHSPADVPGIVSEIGALMAETHDIEITVDTLWPDFSVDPALLKQILQNLISNAVKFNRNTPKRITVGWQPAPEDRIEIFVRDNGIGIAPQYADQIFRIFQRLHTQQEFEGTGIGLAIVRKAAHKLKGSVRMASEPGKGSTFYVELPRQMTVAEDKDADGGTGSNLDS